jgi:hypothetical protein
VVAIFQLNIKHGFLIANLQNIKILDSDPCASRHLHGTEIEKDYLVKCEKLFERKKKLKNCHKKFWNAR